LRVLGSLVADPGRAAFNIPPVSKKNKVPVAIPKFGSSNIVNGEVISLAAPLCQYLRPLLSVRRFLLFRFLTRLFLISTRKRRLYQRPRSFLMAQSSLAPHLEMTFILTRSSLVQLLHTGILASSYPCRNQSILEYVRPIKNLWILESVHLL